MNHQDLCNNYPELSDAQYKQAVALGRELRQRFPVEGLDDAARLNVVKRADKEFSRKVRGGEAIFVNGQLNFLHNNRMLRL